MPKLVFIPKYFLLSLALFLSEVVIELFAHDDFIRPIFGDYLVVILLYCIIRTFLKVKTINACIFVLTLSFALEFAQAFQLLKILNLSESYWAKILLGSSFSFGDLIAYSLGVITVYILETHFFDKK